MAERDGWVMEWTFWATRCERGRDGEASYERRKVWKKEGKGREDEPPKQLGRFLVSLLELELDLPHPPRRSQPRTPLPSSLPS